MIDILDVFYEIIENFSTCKPEAKHYLENLPEKKKTPCFLYLLVFSKDTQNNYFIKDTIIDIQIIYFDKTDGYDKKKFEDKMQTVKKLKQFLSQFNLKVDNRNLKFDYEIGNADNKIMINMRFDFKDEVINLGYDEEQARQMMEEININYKELKKWDCQAF